MNHSYERNIAQNLVKGMMMFSYKPKKKAKTSRDLVAEMYYRNQGTYSHNRPTCKPKRYQHAPTTWLDNIKVRRFMTKFAHADSNMNPLGD